jgi:hypothetical protein
MINGLPIHHIIQFSKLCEMLDTVQLDDDTLNSIMWKFTNNVCYSAYKMNAILRPYHLLHNLLSLEALGAT